jgi:phosphate transport system substrate-binding protein
MRPLHARLPVLAAISIAAPLATSGCGARKASDYGAATSQTPVRGDGASQPAALYDAWVTLYRIVDPTAPASYHGSSSSAGVEAMKKGTADFAASDAPVDEAKVGVAVVQIPTTLVAVAVVYRLDARREPLRLEPDAIAKLLQGQVRDWRDYVPASSTPAPPVKLFFRKESSGTTAIFSDFLQSRATAAWRIGKTSSLASEWLAPGAVAVASNDELVAKVASTDGGLGFVGLATARAAHLSVAEVKNDAGAYVAPTLDAITAAAAGVTDLRATLVNRPGAATYPIVSFSYVVARKDDDDLARGRAVARFLWWGVHDGQRLGPALGFATLPPEIVVQAETLLRGLRAGGEPAVRGL